MMKRMFENMKKCAEGSNGNVLGKTLVLKIGASPKVAVMKGPTKLHKRKKK